MPKGCLLHPAFATMRASKGRVARAAGGLRDGYAATFASAWDVFGRVKSLEQAEEALTLIRKQYDEAQAYRAEIARIYRAQTTRRC